MFDEDLLGLGAIGIAARLRHSAQHGQSVGKGILAGFVDLAQDVERAGRQYFDRDARVLDITIGQPCNDAVLQLGGGQAAHIDLADQRHRDHPRPGDGELATQRRIAEHHDPHPVAARQHIIIDGKLRRSAVRGRGDLLPRSYRRQCGGQEQRHQTGRRISRYATGHRSSLGSFLLFLFPTIGLSTVHFRQLTGRLPVIL